MLDNTTALLRSEEYRLFSFYSVAADLLVARFFPTQHLSIKKAVVEIGKNKKEGSSWYLNARSHQ